MNDLDMTVTGWVATDPAMHELSDGREMCVFRMAHSSRYRDSEGQWKDSPTEWFAVRMFRKGARRVGQSIRVGHPIIVQGRLRTNSWIDKDGVERREMQIDAAVVGHDLTLGTATFVRHRDASGVEGGDQATVASDDNEPGQFAQEPSPVSTTQAGPAGLPDSFDLAQPHGADDEVEVGGGGQRVATP